MRQRAFLYYVVIASRSTFKFPITVVVEQLRLLLSKILCFPLRFEGIAVYSAKARKVSSGAFKPTIERSDTACGNTVTFSEPFDEIS